MNRDFAEMLDALSGAEAEFLIVGAYALAARQAAGDLDIWIRPAPMNAERVWRALESFGAPLGEVTRADLAANDIVFQIGVEPARIDILTTVSGLDFEPAWSRRDLFEVDGKRLPFLSRADLIHKKTLARPRDLADVADLEADSKR